LLYNRLYGAYIYIVAGSEMEGVTVGGFAFDLTFIDLRDRKLSEDELLPFLEGFRNGKFPNLWYLRLVISTD